MVWFLGNAGTQGLLVQVAMERPREYGPSRFHALATSYDDQLANACQARECPERTLPEAHCRAHIAISSAYSFAPLR
jgi:hypothetical protein